MPTDDVVARLRSSLNDRYRIDRELGAGGMATVFLAHDLRHERDVAIKVLHPELGAALGGDRFLAEIKTTAKLQHPHILPLLDSGDAGGLLYYVMPYVAGETLRGRLERERQLPIEDALRVTREIADALGAAHALGIVHRDIKPENVLLQGGHALVADFGIALAVQHAGGARMTQTGLSLGTPQYMAPEQAMGERQIDARADLYALGAVTYEMLTGEPPFTGNSVQAIVSRVLTEEPRPIAPQRKAVPASVESAVLRALEKLPADRFNTAAEFVAALDHGVSSARRPAKATSGGANRSRLLAVSGTVLVALAIAGGWLLGRRGSTAGAGVAWSTSVVLPDSLPLAPLFSVSEGMPTLAIAPDGSQLVFVARRGAHTQLFVRRLSDFSVRALEGTDDAFAPFFSPQGDAVGFFVEGEVRRVSLLDGRVTVMARNAGEPAGGAWLPDGRLVFSRSRGGRLMVTTATGDSVQSILCPLLCGFPEPLADGRHVLAASGARLSIIDITTGSIAVVRRWDAKSDADELRAIAAHVDGDGHLVYATPGGQLFAAPFDEAHARLTGPPASLADGVRTESGRGAVQFAVSRDGVIAYVPGDLMSLGILVRADRAGRLDTVPAPPASYNSLELSPDGRRVVARVAAATGDMELQVIDVMSGRVSPWLRGADLGRPVWLADSRRVLFKRDDRYFVGDPDLGDSPRPLALPATIDNVIPTSDSTIFAGWVHDTLVVVRSDGHEIRRIVARYGLHAVSSDNEWTMEEESTGASSSGVIARALDGSGRRIVVTTTGRFGQVTSMPDDREFIIVSEERSRADAAVGTLQDFYSVAYDPSNHDNPFGEPRLLFKSAVADFPGRNYGVGARGARFVFKQHIATAPLHEVRLIGAWHRQLGTVAKQ